MFLLDELDWYNNPMNAILAVAFTITFALFLTGAILSGGVLLFNALFGYTTYPDKESTTNDQHPE